MTANNRKRKTATKKLYESMSTKELVGALKEAEATVGEIKNYLKSVLAEVNFRPEPQLPVFSNSPGLARGFDKTEFPDTFAAPVPGMGVPPANTDSPPNTDPTKAAPPTLSAPIAQPLMTDYYAADDPLNMGVEEELNALATITNTDQAVALPTTSTDNATENLSEAVTYQ